MLADALVELIDHRGKTPKKLGGDWTATGHRVVSALNLKGNRVDDNDHHYISAEMYARWMKVPLEAGDVLLTSEAPTGEVAYLAERREWAIGQRLFGLRGKPGVLDGRYLYYALRGGDARHELISRVTGTTVSGIRQSELVKIQLDLPPIGEQRSIAAALGALDDKIESNRRAAATALELAEALYLDACARGSEPILLRDAGRWLSGGTPSTSRGDYWGGDLPWISAASLKSFYVLDSDRRLTDAGASAATNIVPSGSLLLVVRGMSLKTELRFGLAQRAMAFGQDCKAILPSIPSAVLALALRSSQDVILDLVDEAGHGTGRLSTDLLEQHQVQVPIDPSVVEALDVLVARGAALEQESARLTVVRDALLPGLLSGRIRVPEAALVVQDDFDESESA